MLLKHYSILLAASLSWQLLAQAPQPAVLDTVFDSQQRALRPVLGTLGAALVTGTIDAGMPISMAEHSPSRNYILAVNGDNGSLSVLKTASGQITSNSVNAPARPDKISLSPTGQSAVLFYSRNRLLIVLTGLPDSPAVTRSVSVAGTGAVSADKLAISDDGEAVAVSVRQSDSSVRPLAPASLYVDYSGVLQRVEDVSDVSAIAFLPGGEDMLVADRTANHLLLGHNGTGGLEWTVAASRNSNQAAINGIAVSADNNSVFAVSVSGEVLQLDSNNSQLLAIANCACAPTGLFTLPGNARFRLNNLPDAPLWVFDGDSSPARMVFIPVDPLSGAGMESRQ